MIEDLDLLMRKSSRDTAQEVWNAPPLRRHNSCLLPGDMLHLDTRWEKGLLVLPEQKQGAFIIQHPARFRRAMNSILTSSRDGLFIESTDLKILLCFSH